MTWQIPFHLLIIFFDIRDRKIPLYLFIALLFTAITEQLLSASFPELVERIMINWTVLTVQLFITAAFIKVLKGKKTPFIDHYFGLADIVLLYILGCSLSPSLYCICYLLALLAALIFTTGFNLFSQKKLIEIPFAAFISFIFLFLQFWIACIGASEFERMLTFNGN